MDITLDEYVIYVRSENAASLDDIEQPVASCASYEDAVRCQRTQFGLVTLIRYRGDVGGGD